MANHKPIRSAIKLISPGVREAMERQGDNARRAGRKLDHVQQRTIEQTLWELQRLGLLVTPEGKVVLDKATTWAATFHDSDDVEDQGNEQDVALWWAVQDARPVADVEGLRYDSTSGPEAGPGDREVTL